MYIRRCSVGCAGAVLQNGMANPRQGPTCLGRPHMQY